MSPFSYLLFTFVLAASSDPVTLDFRGLSPERAQVTLTEALPRVAACLAPPIAPRPAKRGAPPVVPEALPSKHLLSLLVGRPGLVVHAKVEGHPRLDARCVQRALLPLTFGEISGSATRVNVPLRCSERTCAFPWTVGP